MKHLTTAQREELAGQLEALRRQVLQELTDSRPGTFAEARLNESRDIRERAEQAEAEREDDVRQAEIEVDRRRLHEIELAQSRLLEGRYGICATCGACIPARRLMAQPTAVRCAACQAQVEAGQLRT